MVKLKWLCVIGKMERSTLATMFQRPWLAASFLQAWHCACLPTSYLPSCRCYGLMSCFCIISCNTWLKMRDKDLHVHKRHKTMVLRQICIDGCSAQPNVERSQPSTESLPTCWFLSQGCSIRWFPRHLFPKCARLGFERLGSIFFERRKTKQNIKT